MYTILRHTYFVVDGQRIVVPNCISSSTCLAKGAFFRQAFIELVLKSLFPTSRLVQFCVVVLVRRRLRLRECVSQMIVFDVQSFEWRYSICSRLLRQRQIIPVLHRNSGMLCRPNFAIPHQLYRCRGITAFRSSEHLCQVR